MTSYTVITENDESAWEDTTGVSYHFPRRYVKYLETGTKIVYYKGGIKNASFRHQRLTDAPHYFGFAEIGRVYPDVKSTKGDHFAEIQGFYRFSAPVFAKQDGGFIETIPDSRKANYWRDGVRPITEEVFAFIKQLGKFTDNDSNLNSLVSDTLQGLPESLSSGVEGKPELRLVTTFERDPKLREAAIRIHGTTCLGCGFNFAAAYGQHGAGYIQVHHVEPLGESPGERVVDAEKDLVVLCANCHVMVHRYRARTLTLEQLRSLIAGNVRGESFCEIPVK